MSSGLRWLLHLERLLLASVTQADWTLLREFQFELKACAADAPHAEGATLLAVKTRLAKAGYGAIDIPKSIGGRGCSSTVQMLVQFLCGYEDLNYRDAAHVGHGRLILANGSKQQLDQWSDAILSGALVGVAVTEPHGGTLIQSMRTTAIKAAGSKWLLSGEKCWISRINEASLFVVFFKLADSSNLAAALIDPKQDRVSVEVLQSAGLTGWSWGRVRFDQLEFDDSDFLGPNEGGLDLFRQHFAYYRPIVAMTALGGAAAIFDEVMKQLSIKVHTKSADSVRDSAWEALGRSFIEIQSAILSSIVAQQLLGERHDMGAIWSRSSKAFSCESAHRISSKLAVFAGATAYHKQSRVAKIYEDLRAFLYADGVIDALFRSSGRELYDAGWVEDRQH
jgi:alkylation response protein AidB-like acyl-CoA dehydrogenase